MQYNDFSVLVFPTPTWLAFANRDVNQSKPFPDREFCGDISFVSAQSATEPLVVVIVKHFLPILRTFFALVLGLQGNNCLEAVHTSKSLGQNRSRRGIDKDT